MFPAPLRNATATTVDYTTWGVGGLWTLAGKVSWVTITSALVLLAVPLYEADQVRVGVVWARTMVHAE